MRKWNFWFGKHPLLGNDIGHDTEHISTRGAKVCQEPSQRPGLWKSHYLEDQIIPVFEFLIEFQKGGTSHNNVLEQLAGMGLTARNDSENLLLNSIFHAAFHSIVCAQGPFCTPSLYSNLMTLKKRDTKCHRNIICLLVDIHQHCTHIYQRVGQVYSPRANLVNVYISWLIWVEKTVVTVVQG